MGRTTLRAIIVGGLLLIGCEASQTMTDTSPAADADVPPVNEVLAPADAPQDSGPAPGADDDGDGYPNAMEERFGSDPQDASSRPPDLDGDLIPDDDDPDRDGDGAENDEDAFPDDPAEQLDSDEDGQQGLMVSWQCVNEECEIRAVDVHWVI